MVPACHKTPQKTLRVPRARDDPDHAARGLVWQAVRRPPRGRAVCGPGFHLGPASTSSSRLALALPFVAQLRSVLEHFCSQSPIAMT